MPMEFTEKEILDTMSDLGCTREEAIECLTIEKNIRNFLRNFYNVKVLRTFIVYYGFQGRGC